MTKFPSKLAACVVIVLGVTMLSGCVGATRAPLLAQKNRTETCVEPIKGTTNSSRRKSTEPPAVVGANLPREIDKFQ